MGERVVTVNEVLDGHVALDIQCLDRIYPTTRTGVLSPSTWRSLDKLTHRWSQRPCARPRPVLVVPRKLTHRRLTAVVPASDRPGTDNRNRAGNRDRIEAASTYRDNTPNASTRQRDGLRQINWEGAHVQPMNAAARSFGCPGRVRDGP
jgi:hypothetical protein